MVAAVDDKKQPAQVIKLVQRQLDESSPFNELRDSHIAFVNYFAQDIMRLQRWRVDLDVRARPRTITIVPLDDEGRPLVVRFKHERAMLEKINGFLQLRDYVVKFHSR